MLICLWYILEDSARNIDKTDESSSDDRLYSIHNMYNNDLSRHNRKLSVVANSMTLPWSMMVDKKYHEKSHHFPNMIDYYYHYLRIVIAVLLLLFDDDGYYCYCWLLLRIDSWINTCADGSS